MENTETKIIKDNNKNSISENQNISNFENSNSAFIL